MTKYFTKYTVEQADSSSETAYVRDTEAVHKEDFKHISPYVRLTTADLMKDPGGDPLVPYIVQPWNTNTMTTKVDADKEIKLYNLDDAIFKEDASKKVTLQFVVYIPDNYTANITDLKGTTIRSKDLHGFTITDNNSKNSHYRVEEEGFGSFDVIDINLWNLGTVEQHNSINYDRAVIINVKATQGTNRDGDDELGIRLWINNEDVSKMDTLPFFIISEAGTIDPTNSLVQDNDKYSKSEIDNSLALKADVGDSYTKAESDGKYLTNITNEKLENLKNVPTPTLNDDKKYLQYDHGNDEFKYADGPKGPKGDKGDTGPRGQQGVQGATGPAGATTLTGLTDTNFSTLVNGQTLKVTTKADGSKEWVNAEDVVYTDQDVNPAKIGTFYFLSTHSNDRELQLPDHNDLVDNDSFYLLATHFNDTSKNYKIKVGSGSTASYNLVQYTYIPGSGGTQSNNKDEYTMRTVDMGIVWRLTYDKTNKGWTMTGVFDWNHLSRSLDSLSNVTMVGTLKNNEVLRWNSTTKKWENGDAGAQGPKGDKGDKGDTGPRGPAGAGGSGGSGFLVSTNVTGGVFAKKADGSYPVARTGYWVGYTDEGAVLSLSDGDTLTMTSASGLTCTVNKMEYPGSDALNGMPFAPNQSYWGIDNSGTYRLELEFNKSITIIGYTFDSVNSGEEGRVWLYHSRPSDGLSFSTRDWRFDFTTSGKNGKRVITNDGFTSKKFHFHFVCRGSSTNASIRKLRFFIQHNANVPANPFPNGYYSTGASVQITSTNSEKYTGAIINTAKPYAEVDAGSEIFLDRSNHNDKVRTISAGDVEAYTLGINENINIWKV